MFAANCPHHGHRWGYAAWFGAGERHEAKKGGGERQRPDRRGLSARRTGWFGVRGKGAMAGSLPRGGGIQIASITTSRQTALQEMLRYFWS